MLLQIDSNLRGKIRLQESLYSSDQNDEPNPFLELRFLIENMFLKYCDKTQLILVPKKKCWIMQIDVFILGGGMSLISNQNLLDMIALSIRGALQDCEIPKLNVVYNQLQDEYDYELETTKNEQSFMYDASSVPLLI